MAVALWAEAGDYHSSGSTNSTFLVATTRHEEGPALMPADRAYIQSGTNRFSFLIPSGLKLVHSNYGNVSLVSQDYDCQIRFQIHTTEALPDDQLKPEWCWQKILREHPEASMLCVVPAVADSRRGLAFQISFPGPGGSPRRGHVAFIPGRTGVFQFELQSASTSFEASLHQFNTVLLTFRASDESGQLQVSPLSDKL